MKRLLLLSLLTLSVALAQTVNFDTDIQPIFNASCTGCHGSSGGLNLTTGQSYNNLVDVVSSGYAPALRVVSGDSANSVLYNKVAGNGTNGQQMPVGGTLTADQITLIATWITELGAVTPITIAEARATAEGETVTIEGIITSPNFGTPGGYSEYTIQDPTAALVIYSGGFDALLAWVTLSPSREPWILTMENWKSYLPARPISWLKAAAMICRPFKNSPWQQYWLTVRLMRQNWCVWTVSLSWAEPGRFPATMPIWISVIRPGLP